MLTGLGRVWKLRRATMPCRILLEAPLQMLFPQHHRLKILVKRWAATQVSLLHTLLRPTRLEPVVLRRTEAHQLLLARRRRMEVPSRHPKDQVPHLVNPPLQRILLNHIDLQITLKWVQPGQRVIQCRRMVEPPKDHCNDQRPPLANNL